MEKPAENLSALEILTNKLTLWLQAAVSMLPNLMLATLIMVGFWIGARVFSNLVYRVLRHTSESHAATHLIVTIVKLIVLFFGLFTSLSILKLDKAVASLLAGAGVIGLAIGFAFQEIAANFFSGVLIAIRKPYREADIVQMDDKVGVVNEITLRTTNLKTFDGLEVLIPNKDMFTKAVTNFTKTPDRRVDLDVGVSYGEDLRKVEKIVREAVEDVPKRITGRDIEFYYKEFGDSSINFQVRIWITFHKQIDYLDAVHHAVIAIKEAFDKNEIVIPFPIRTLDFGIKGGISLSKMLQPREKA